MAEEKTQLEQFFDKQASAALWDVAVSLKRGNALPLDANSVFQSMEKVEAYCNGGGPAYPGQIIAIVEETGTQICYLDKDLNVCPVGIIPTGDSKTIQVTPAGAISLIGATDAANGTLPMLENGALVWKTLEDIGAGDGNDDTTYEFSFTNEKITIKPLFNGKPIKVKDEEGEDTEVDTIYELDLSNFVTSTELESVIGKAAEGETAATGLYKAIADGIQEAKNYADTNDANTTYTMTYGDDEDGKKVIRLVDDKNTVISEIDASAFIADGVLNNVEYDAENDKLIFTWNIIENTTEDGEIIYKTVEVDVKDLVDTYTAGNGLDLANNAFSVKRDTTSEDFLTISADGVKLSGVQAAIDTAKGEAATDAQSKADAAKQAAIDDADGKLALKANVADVYTKSQTYSQDEIDELLENIQAGSSESAASVKTQLDSYKKIVNTEVWGNEDGSGDSRIDKLEAVGAQANVLENVIGAADNRLQISTINEKTITIDDSNLRTDIATAKKAGDDAAVTANANATAIEGHDSRISTLEAAKTTHDNQIKALQEADTTANGKIQALETTVNNTESGVAATFAKAAQNATDIATLIAKDKVHDEDIAALKTSTGNNATAITSLQEAIGNVYTKTESEGKFVAKETGKSLVSDTEIARLAEINNYDDTAIKALIQANTDAISAEKTRAEDVEADHEKRIADMETFWSAADDPEGTIDKLAEIVAYIEADKTGALDMAADIKANTDAIAAINNSETGVLATAKGYTDSSIAALQASIHGVDDDTIKLSENKAYVAKISTDILVQGSTELIFSAGNASGYNIQA